MAFGAGGWDFGGEGRWVRGGGEGFVVGTY